MNHIGMLVTLCVGVGSRTHATRKPGKSAHGSCERVLISIWWRGGENTNFLSVEVVTALAGLATGIGASSITTWLLNRYDRRHPAVDVDKIVKRIEELNEQIDLSTLADKLDDLNNAVIELAYLRIRERHENAMRHGWMHPNEKHVLERLYHAYHSIGGNGVGTQMIEEIRNLPSMPPEDDPASSMCDETWEPPETY